MLITNGYKRSLIIIVNRFNDSLLDENYPKTYDGRIIFSLTDNDIATMSAALFSNYFNQLVAYIKDNEIGISDAQLNISQALLYDPTICEDETITTTTTTTTTSTTSSTTTTITTCLDCTTSSTTTTTSTSTTSTSTTTTSSTTTTTTTTGIIVTPVYLADPIDGHVLADFLGLTISQAIGAGITDSGHVYVKYVEGTVENLQLHIAFNYNFYNDAALTIPYVGPEEYMAVIDTGDPSDIFLYQVYVDFNSLTHLWFGITS